jgi:hypothetical protein
MVVVRTTHVEPAPRAMPQLPSLRARAVSRLSSTRTVAQREQHQQSAQLVISQKICMQTSHIVIMISYMLVN